jgi:hypothetical protein
MSNAAHRRFGMPILVVLSIVGLAACGAREIPGSGSTTPRFHLVTVDHPLDVTKYGADPCLSLSPEQRARFGATAPGQSQTSAGLPSCMWRFGSAGAVLGYVVYDTSPTGLAGLDALHKDRNPHDYYIPTSIEGYPAAYNAFNGERDIGTCDLSVATSPTAYFTTSISSAPGADGCAAAKNLAAAVIETIRKGA